MKLDYGSATLAGLLAVQLDRLQSVLNAAARLIHRRRKFDHVSPLLKELHWLRVPERITFRLAVLAYRCQHDKVPRYLTARCLNVCGTLHIVYTIYYPQYGLTLLAGLGLEDIPTLCLK